MRKTVVLLKGYPRLSETFIAQELRGLELAGQELHLVSMRHPTDTRRHPVHDEIQAPVSYLPEYLHDEPRRVLRALARVAARAGFWAAARRFLGDLIRDPSRNRVRRFGQAAVLAAEWPRDAGWLHVHFLHTPASVGSYAALMIGTGWTVSAHAKDIWTSPDWDLRAKLGHADWCVTCTRSGWEHLRSLAPREETVHLSYHGLNLDRFGPWDGAASDRDGLGDPVRLVSVGRLVPKKGYDVLLHALALLPADLNWRFDHIGGGPEIETLRPLAAELGLSDRIAWRGALPQQDVLALYRESDLFALPSRITPDGDRDGLPNVMVEAASQRLCCIGTNISGIPELFTDGENGLLVPPEDAPALAAALERAMRDPALRARLGQAAETRVRRDFNAASSVAELKALFQASWGRA
ncbi:glycosyltransferase family 4 protein [Paracoccus laeviglucosivorans]|uniref:Glycosyltransferase involved in cell wall bisynthesis n=1 Tax=Paracoccus laeviglucosivorans TaxID=1197861 RepID=A0A521D2U7_9RHOB|nr:glycosyltransferase family 4 protein [Paracoccus laeviglucosivorans]SMO66018.1 Glycosyltransferase involved in cell wall bisynthesis [Paracoccus laeviglucosivorans]